MSNTTRGARGVGARSKNQVLATGLGWFSIGLGLAELFAPRAICRSLGMDGHENLVRAYGAREIATGVAILATHDPQPWIWGRVAGDGLDLATLATGLHGDNSKKDNVLVGMAVVAGATAIDVLCATRLTAEQSLPETAIVDYSDRSGLPRGIEASRGLASEIRPQDGFISPTPSGAQPATA